MKKVVRTLATTLSLAMVLTACGGGSGSNKKDSGAAAEDSKKEFGIVFNAPSLVVKNEGEAIEGGTVNYGLINESPVEGIFEENLSQSQYDSYIQGLYQGGNLYNLDESFRIVSSDKVDINYDFENNQITWKLNKDLKWNDGTPVTSKDLAYSYEVVGHPDYTGVRYDPSEDERIIGMKEYHAGQADSISGLEMPDDQTLVVKYTKLTPATQWGAGMKPSLMPYHYLKDVAIKDLESCDQIRLKPLSWGPFYISSMVQGEKFELSANPNWYKGKPGLDKINVEVLSSSNVVAAMKAHKYDILSEVPSKAVNELKEVPGYQMVGKGQFYYSYLGFALGHYDKENENIIPNPDAKMANVNLRKAMGYAIDQMSIAEKFYKGNNTLAKSVILPVFTDFYNHDIEGYTYDVEKAKSLLDEAGYKDVDGDGFREDPKGQPLVIKLAMMSGGDTAEPLSQYYLQCWEQIGLKVELSTGRLIEMKNFYEMVQNEDPEIDVFAAAWGVGTNPSPKESYGNHAAFNLSRYTSETLQEPIDRITSDKASDPEFLAKAYKDFQKAVFDEVPVIPMQWRNEWTIVNKRLLNVDAGYGNGAEVTSAGDWKVTSDKPLEK